LSIATGARIGLGVERKPDGKWGPAWESTQFYEVQLDAPVCLELDDGTQRAARVVHLVFPAAVHPPNLAALIGKSVHARGRLAPLVSVPVNPERIAVEDFTLSLVR
jgi:hypothetical protein